MVAAGGEAMAAAAAHDVQNHIAQGMTCTYAYIQRCNLYLNTGGFIGDDGVLRQADGTPATDASGKPLVVAGKQELRRSQ